MKILGLPDFIWILVLAVIGVAAGVMGWAPAALHPGYFLLALCVSISVVFAGFSLYALWATEADVMLTCFLIAACVGVTGLWLLFALSLEATIGLGLVGFVLGATATHRSLIYLDKEAKEKTGVPLIIP